MDTHDIVAIDPDGNGSHVLTFSSGDRQQTVPVGGIWLSQIDTTHVITHVPLMATDDGAVLDIRIAECVEDKTIKPDGNLMACTETSEAELSVPDDPGEFPEVWKAKNWPSDTTDARDGRDLSACIDLECQVTVVEGDTIEQAPNSGTSSIAVSRVTSKEVTLRIGGEEYPTAVGSTLGGGLDGEHMKTYSPLLADDGAAVLDIRVVPCVDGLYPMPSGDKAECMS